MSTLCHSTTHSLKLGASRVLGDCKIATVNEWMSIFEQADRWQIEHLREKALDQLPARARRDVRRGQDDIEDPGRRWVLRDGDERGEGECFLDG